MEATVVQLEREEQHLDRPTTILVVDDDESQVVSLQHRLQKQDYRVVAAYNATQAKLAALDSRPDLVLLDLHLPDQDGLELCAQLADHPRTCGVPIIILSAFERPDIVRRARAVGSSYYVRKPYDPNVLLTLIETSLRSSSELDW